VTAAGAANETMTARKEERMAKHENKNRRIRFMLTVMLSLAHIVMAVEPRGSGRAIGSVQ